MNKHLDAVLASIGEEYKDRIDNGSRFYLEVDIGKRAEAMGYEDVKDEYTGVNAIVPLKRPELGMTVRIDGRTFVNYARYDSGIATPGYVARESGLPHTGFVANDSMLLNCA
jgi:hypothetical protein